MTTQQATNPIAEQWLISSDSHIVEPPDLWQSRTSDARSPRVVREADGDWWYIDGRKTMSFLGIQPGMRFEKDPSKLRTSATFAEVSPAAYDPKGYLVANEDDGVWGSVIYPSEGLVLFSVPNTEVVTNAMSVYNDWIADFCSHDTTRLKGIAMINVDDPVAACQELRRCHDLGLAGALITVAPPAWLPYRSPEFDVFWTTASELKMPLSLHVGTDRGDPRAQEFVLDIKNVPPSVFVNKDYPVRRTLGRSALFRRLRAISPIAHRDGGARAGMDSVLPPAAGRHVYRQAPPRAGMAPLSRPGDPTVAIFPYELLRLLPRGRPGSAATRHDRRGDADVGQRLPAYRIDVSTFPADSR